MKQTIILSISILISGVLVALSCYFAINQYTSTFNAYQNIEELNANDISENTVYITPSGNKYHRASCYYLNNEYKATTISIAKENGYMPCVKCEPSTLDWDNIRKLNGMSATNNEANNELTKEEYFEKVNSGANTRIDDLKASKNGWADENK